MTITETAKITTKGQITITNRIRKLLHLKKGSSVGFSITKEGVILVPCKITATSPYTAKEWVQIEKLANEKGEQCSEAEDAKAYIKKL